MNQVKLDQTLRSVIRDAILEKIIPIYIEDWSYDEVFDELVDFRNPQQADALGAIQHSMTKDSTQQKYQTLISAGFDDDFSRQVSGFVQPFDSEQIQFLQTSSSKDDLLDKLSLSKPFLADLIRSLEINVSNSKFVLRRLRSNGMPENLIHTYLIYRSGRPQTIMSQMTIVEPFNLEIYGMKLFTSVDPVLISADWLNKIVEVHQPSLFPVVRYGAGMSKGTYTKTYVSKTDEEFCGTFFYYEPDSTVFLRATNILFCPNKICAMAYLIGIDETAKIFDSDFKVGTQQYHRTRVREVLDATSWNGVITEMLVGNFDFTIHYPEMYALEDRFDQLLCNAARDRFELVVLTSMTGETRVVTEILDTRSRNLSFQSLGFVDY